MPSLSPWLRRLARHPVALEAAKDGRTKSNQQDMGKTERMNPPIIRTKDLIADTLELMSIIDNCEEFGGCYLWNGHTNGNGHPKKRRTSVRRIAWEANNGPIPKGMFVTTCNNIKCLSCLKLVTKAQITRKAMKNPATQLKRRAAGARANRPSFGKITMEIAREIRLSEKTGKEWAKELGVSKALVSHVRCGRSWVEHSNPFAGLMR